MKEINLKAVQEFTGLMDYHIIQHEDTKLVSILEGHGEFKLDNVELEFALHGAVRHYLQIHLGHYYDNLYMVLKKFNQLSAVFEYAHKDIDKAIIYDAILESRFHARWIEESERQKRITEGLDDLPF